MNDTGMGNHIVEDALRHARSQALICREYGRPLDRMQVGMALGEIIIAAVYLQADPVVVQAAKNEVHFLGSRQ